MIASLVFDSKWIYGNGGANSRSVNRFIQKCRGKYGSAVEICDSSLDNCKIQISVDCTADELRTELDKMVQEVIAQGGESDSVYKLLVFSDGKDNRTQNKDGDRPLDPKKVDEVRDYLSRHDARDEPKPSAGEPAEVSPAGAGAGTAMELISDLVGAAEFKSLCEEIDVCAPLVVKNHTQRAFFANTYLFSVNLGEGFSYSLQLFSQLLAEDGLFEKSGKVFEIALPDPSDREYAEKFRMLFDKLAVFPPSSIVSFDISSWLTHTTKPEFKQFLLEVLRRSGESVVVFRIPAVSDGLLEQTRLDLEDVIAARTVAFSPFSAQELRALATEMLKEFQFDADEAIWDVFTSRMEEEKRDGYFYGIHTVRKTVNEMIHGAEVYDAKVGGTGKTITAPSIEFLRPAKEDSGLTGMEMLDKLVGMGPISAQLSEIVNQISLSRESGLQPRPCMHMRFVGSPGTGKTTVARILGKILHDAGILRIGKFYEHRGRDLCGRYVGETAPRTAEICREAYGSVLFIDEAYSLYRGDESSNDYGREAIDTLIAEMENHSDDLLVIFAGYEKDMDVLLQANTGLASRIPYTLRFPNYTRQELCKIFQQMCGEHFRFGDGFMDASSAYFSGLPDTVLEDPAFGNARYARNLYERVWSKAALRCPGTKPSQLELTPADLECAVKSLDNVVTAPQTKRIGF